MAVDRSKRTTKLKVSSWSMLTDTRIVFTGLDADEYGGRIKTVCLEIGDLDLEDLYSLGNNLLDFGAMLRRTIEREWNDQAQERMDFGA